MSRKTVDARWTPGAFQRPEAAAYCGVSIDHFDEHIRPHVPTRYLGACKLWLQRDLEAFLGRIPPGPAKMGSFRKPPGAAGTARECGPGGAPS